MQEQLNSSNIVFKKLCPLERAAEPEKNTWSLGADPKEDGSKTLSATLMALEPENQGYDQPEPGEHGAPSHPAGLTW